MLNENYRISVREEQKPLIFSLLRDIRHFLHKTWKVSLQLAKNLKQKSVMIELLHKIVKLDHNAIEQFEWLIKLKADSKEERHLYFNALLKVNDLTRLDSFVRQRTQEKGLIQRYAAHLVALHETERLNRLQTDIVDVPELLEQYLSFLLKIHLADELILLAKQYPENSILIKTIADYFFNQQEGEVLSALLLAIPDNADLRSVYFNLLLQTEDVAKLFDLVQRYPQHTEILTAYLSLLVAKQDGEAMQALLVLFPTSVAVKTEVAFFLLKTQYYQSALTHLDEVLTLTTEYRVYEIQLARSEALKALAQWEDALTALRFAMQIEMNLALQWQEVQLLTQLAQYEEAVHCLQKMPDSPENTACQVILLSRQEDYLNAAQRLESLVGYPCSELQMLCGQVGTAKL